MGRLDVQSYVGSLSRCRAVVTCQVLRYLPDHYLNACRSQSFENGWSLLRSSLTSLSSAVPGYSDHTMINFTADISLLPLTMNQKRSQMVEKSKISLGEHAPRPLAHARWALVMQMHCPLGPLIFTPNHSKFRGYSSEIPHLMSGDPVKSVQCVCME